jgi:hypothetical protein
MTAESVDKRAEFRFPVVVPLEYYRPDHSGILSYSLNLSKTGTFISSEDPLNIDSRFGMSLTIPVDNETSKIFLAEGTVVWKRAQPFKSTSNGMGVRFVDPLPESLLLNALAHDVKKLIKEAEAKRSLEQRLDKLESELEELKRLATLGRYTEKILFEVSSPILTLSEKLELVRERIHAHSKTFETHGGSNREAFKGVAKEFDNCCKEVAQILKAYKIISELAHMGGDGKEPLEKRLKERYSSQKNSS